MATMAAEKMPAVPAPPSTSDVTRRMVCGGLAGMIAKVRTLLLSIDDKSASSLVLLVTPQPVVVGRLIAVCMRGERHSMRYSTLFTAF